MVAFAVYGFYKPLDRFLNGAKRHECAISSPKETKEAKLPVCIASLVSNIRRVKPETLKHKSIIYNYMVQISHVKV